MATVTGLTAERMLAIEAASVVDGDIVGDNLILTQHGGTQINAGNVRGPAGPQGAVGQDLPVITALPVLEVGMVGQIRAGRQLTAADFTNMGVAAPAGLWNLSDLSDASGNGRALLNKGAVPTIPGINGLANTAARFIGAPQQALYIPDTGANDPFRITNGSWGCWFRSAKRGVYMSAFGKWGQVNGTFGWLMQIASSGLPQLLISASGSDYGALAGFTDVVDDRWHFIVCTFDNRLMRLYVDGELDAASEWGSPIYPAATPVNIGGNGADAATDAQNATNGRVDEAFVTADVLSEDQVRNLYCVRLPHTLAVAPSRVSLNVQRRRKGAGLTVADFSAQPLRLYNFSAGSLGDEGSNGVPLANNGNVYPASGVDGTARNSAAFLGAQSLSATDAGIPIGVATRSYGCWFKSGNNVATQVFLAWGVPSTASHTALYLSSGILAWDSGGNHPVGPFLGDNQWHFVVVVEDNTSDVAKRKCYIDGRLIGTNDSIAPGVSGGASAFRIGAHADGTLFFVGQVDSVFITNYAMSMDEVIKLYSKGSQNLGISPKNAGDHVERMDVTHLLATFDSLETQHLVNLTVAP